MKYCSNCKKSFHVDKLYCPYCEKKLKIEPGKILTIMFIVLFFGLIIFIFLLTSSEPAPINGNYTILPEMIYIKGGEFLMGSDRYEKPLHKVKINSFYIGKYEVTLKEYLLYNPSHKISGPYIYRKWEKKILDKLPAASVSWYDAIAYCNWLSDKEGLDRCYNGNTLDITKKGYRLPTEAEWEYACRAGTTTDYYWGNEDANIYCWNKMNSRGYIYPVGLKLPNNFGLYDMSGNIEEWCNDWYDSDYYKISPYNNPLGPEKGDLKVERGGEACAMSNFSSSFFRHNLLPELKIEVIGFRLAKTP